MTTERKSRREFLGGQAAHEQLARMVSRNAQQSELESIQAVPDACANDASRGFLVQITRRAMACDFQVYLNAGQHGHASEAALQALDEVERLEAQLSVYRDDSEVSRINREAGARAVRVEPRLFDLLCESVDLHRATQGAFDITAGRLSRLWGFHRRSGRLPSPAEIRTVLEQVGSRGLELSPVQRSIRFQIPGLEINLGGIGKGYALDRSAQLLAAAGIDDYVIHGGLSSILARGHRAGRRQEGWSAALRHPLIPQRKLGLIRLCDRALGTSGTANQFFHHKGRRFGHILDPRSGWAAEGVLSATVLAPRAALADALSTALFVLGPQESAEFCRQQPDLGMILVCPGQHSGELVVHTHGLSDDEWTPL